MRELLVPLMKPEDPVLWGLVAVIALYALGGAVLAYVRSKRQN